jgi:hypothetical protein
VPSVIRVTNWRPPEAHDGITDEFVERSSVREEDLDHLRQVLVQHLDDLFRLRRLRDRREPSYIGEEDGELASLAAELHLVGIREDVRQDLRRHVAPERRPELRGVRLLGDVLHDRDGEVGEDDGRDSGHRGQDVAGAQGGECTADDRGDGAECECGTAEM